MFGKVMAVGKGILFGALSACLFLFGLVFLPSVSSILFLIAGVLLLPIPKLQKALRHIFPKRAVKGVLCTALAVAALFMTPTDATTSGSPDDSAPPAIEQVIGEEPQEGVQDSLPSGKGEVSQPSGSDPAQGAPTEEASSFTAEPVPEAPAGPDALPDGSTFEVHFLDVGQADAALILCDGAAMLIDGGNSEDSSLIYAYLKERGISHLDYIVATHGHEDHVGGLSGALNYATVGTAYCSVSSYDSAAFKNFVKYLDKQGKEITIPDVGDTFGLGSANVQIVGVDGDAADHNNASIVLRVVYGDTSFLFTGDAEREAEQAILSSGYELESTVLKVGHHGSESSTSYVFLREVAPEYGVISVGEGNSYGHPTEEALSRLRDADVKLFRTDVQGTIVGTSDGREVSFAVSKNEDADTFALPQAKREPVKEPSAPVTVLPVVVEDTSTNEESAKTTDVGTDYVGNKNSDKFHYAWCNSVEKMKESNKFFYTGTRDEMIGMGYKPCANCNP